MKRFAIILTALALVSLAAVAFAGGKECATSTAAKQAAHLTGMHECCAEAAAAGKGCCGQDAAAVKAQYANFQASERALAGMSPCCAAKVTVGQGCCGMDAGALEAKYKTAVSEAKSKQVSAAGGCGSAAVAGCSATCKGAATKTADATKTAEAAAAATSVHTAVSDK